jgi:hypothetical protein
VVGRRRSNLKDRLNHTETCPTFIEEWKWNSPVWSYGKPVCSASAFKKHVGMNFFQGAHFDDPHSLFNGGLESKNSRTVLFYAGDSVNEADLAELIKTAVAHNKGSL